MDGKEKVKGAREAKRAKLPNRPETYQIPRRDLFVDVLVQYGFIQAKKAAGYGEVHAQRLLRDPKVKQAIMARIKEDLEKLDIKRQDLVSEYVDMARKAQSENVKARAYEFLIESSEDKPNSNNTDFIPLMRVTQRLEQSQGFMIPENSGLDRSKDVEIVSEGATKESG
jgi:hypothetical protein